LFFHVIELVLGDSSALEGQLGALFLLLQQSVHEVDVLDLELAELDTLDQALQLLHTWRGF